MKPIGEYTVKELVAAAQEVAGSCDCPRCCKLKDVCGIFISCPAIWRLDLKHKLTAAEYTIFKNSGAKWVSRDEDGSPLGNNDVVFWPVKPEFDAEAMEYLTGQGCDDSWCMPASAFPSINPGDCFSIEECEA